MKTGKTEDGRQRRHRGCVFDLRPFGLVIAGGVFDHLAYGTIVEKGLWSQLQESMFL